MDVNNNDNTGIVLYANLLSDIKTRIRQAQVKATLSANAEMNQDIDSFLPQHVAKSGLSDFLHRPDAKSPSADLILSIPWGHHIFDFLTLTEPFNERELETELVKHLKKFLLELGTGFAFVGRQYHLAISESEYKLTRALPENLKSGLPSIEELEAELSGIHQEERGDE